jgi:NitT/TauT family transport system substrate-binding protein
MKDVPYGRWREYDPEDTVRFYALRLHEVGMLKSSPQKIIAQAPTGASSTSSRKS